jgi:hypothetical protein
MKWQYRVSKQTLDNGDIIYAIREFYDDDQGNYTSWTKDEIAPVGDSIEDLRWVLTKMLEALDKEVIDIGTNK